MARLLVPLAHLHHGGSGSPPGPEFTAFLTGFILFAFATTGCTVLSSVCVLVFTRRLRHLLWSVPLTTLLIYGGRALLFASPASATTQLASTIRLLLLPFRHRKPEAHTE